MFVFGMLDVYKNYTFQLLSENLGLFTVSVFFYCFIKGIERDNLWLQLGGALFLVLSILFRPNIFPFGIIFIILSLYYFLIIKNKEVLKAFLFVLLILLGLSIPAIRNYIICGDLTFLPKQGIKDSIYQTAGFSISFFLNKILFCIGYLPVLEPSYQIRPHWMMMWLGYFIYLFYRIKFIRKLAFWEVGSQLFIFSYYGLSIVFVQVNSYGYRAFIPVTFVVLAFSFMSIDFLTGKNYLPTRP
jgi:hypothetical protein